MILGRTWLQRDERGGGGGYMAFVGGMGGRAGGSETGLGHPPPRQIRLPNTHAQQENTFVTPRKPSPRGKSCLSLKEGDATTVVGGGKSEK